MKNDSEFQRFDATMRKLIGVSHDTLKAKLDAEKQAKPKRKRKAKPSASDDRASREQR